MSLSKIANTTVEHSPVITEPLFCPVNINQWQSSNPIFEAVKWDFFEYTTLNFFHLPSYPFTLTDSDYWLVLAAFSFALIWRISSAYLLTARGSHSSWEVEKFHPPPSCEPPSPCINNVSSSTEESLFLRSGVGYKEESRCRNQERGAEVAPFSGGLLTEIGCFLNRSAPVSAGPGSDSASHSSRIS